ncbi:Hypothetical protein SMAX5B_013007 [Scophthalmus maximus]|uniref:Uncharacterized protein n=1 Tax=Scophthalmus maximus TaxID=52904 RepID=A0A2U9CMC7_SCOMX|nr:Hypothetical protein SMAX5B_013007 [Scophthalmus maximus]
MVIVPPIDNRMYDLCDKHRLIYMVHMVRIMYVDMGCEIRNTSQLATPDSLNGDAENLWQ